jgi:hypothetical protein
MSETRIYSSDGSRSIGRCDGPSRSGVCPGVAENAVVPCAGHLVAAAGPPGALGLLLLVDPAATVCPLAGLGAGFLDRVGRPSIAEEEEALR